MRSRMRWQDRSGLWGPVEIAQVAEHFDVSVDWLKGELPIDPIVFGFHNLPEYDPNARWVLLGRRALDAAAGGPITASLLADLEGVSETSGYRRLDQLRRRQPHLFEDTTEDIAAG